LESVCDLSNAILRDPAWNPLELYSPAALNPNPIKFGEARELVADVPVEAEGYSDVYFDDTCALGVDLPGTNNVTKIERAVLLALETVVRPLMENEPIPCHDVPAKNKFEAEAVAEGTKMILGWHFNFRLLAISLPDNNIAWSGSFTIMLDSKESTAKELNTCISEDWDMSLGSYLVSTTSSAVSDVSTTAQRTEEVSPSRIKPRLIVKCF
jgi:hypothetical protein